MPTLADAPEHATGVHRAPRASPILERRRAMRAHHVNAEILRDRILQLESEHSGLDRLIDRMSEEPGIDDLELQRLKKRKLKLKDTIILLQLQLEPDAHG
jgi:hypothetical protein